MSVATWIADAGILYCSARSGGVSLDLAQAVSSVFMLNVGIAVPLTIANTGVFEASLGYALKANLPSLAVERAVGIAAVHHFQKIAGPAACLVLLSALKQARAWSVRRRLRAEGVY